MYFKRLPFLGLACLLIAYGTVAQNPVQSGQVALQPPVAIPFILKKAGFVTLVIENSAGMRVRNLVSETWFPAGKQSVPWDGMDDLGRDPDAARHGVYQIPAHFVEPGQYRVRGLVRDSIKPIYEFTPYSTGTPPWSTPDHKGAWLGNHTAPMAAAFVPAAQSPTGQPAVYLGCYVTEGPDGLAWVDLDGKKLGGKTWIGGTWTAAPYLARDAGPEAIPGNFVYTVSVWVKDSRSGLLELRVNALTANRDKTILSQILEHEGSTKEFAERAGEIGGLAVHNGLIVISMPFKKQLWLVDGKTSLITAKIPLDAPGGLAFDRGGHLLAISGTSLVLYNSLNKNTETIAPKTVIRNLSAPFALTLDDQENIYISDRGISHQVKVFTKDGKWIRSIGKPGIPGTGPYDPLHLNNPAGLTIDSRKQLWVTEQDNMPKRVSVWSLNGQLLRTFYGPGKYGGGGTIDAKDKTRFYYSDEERGAMEFKLDWAQGTSELKSVIYRPTPSDLKLGFRAAGPEIAFYRNNKRYFSDAYNSSPTNGNANAFLFIERDGLAVPCAAMGLASSWDVLKAAEFKSLLPVGVDLNSVKPEAQALFIWSDLNADGQVQAAELAFQKTFANGVNILDDLSFCIARVGEQARQYQPFNFTDQGIPHYAFDQSKLLADGVFGPASSGGNQVLSGKDGWTVLTLGIKPFSPYSVSGAKNGVPMWSYPSLWPGLHASHTAPKPDRPGEMIGTTRLVGGLIEVKGFDTGQLWAMNGNQGNVYLMTTDGLFVATLFEDMRVGKRWSMPIAQRGMRLDGLTLGDENFWPTMTQTSDGDVYLVDGTRSAIVRLDGINSISRLPVIDLIITKSNLEKSRDYLLRSEALRQQSSGDNHLDVAISKTAPIVDGKLDDWASVSWANIDKRGTKAWFNANTKPYDITGAVKIAGDRLYVAYRTGDSVLLKNSGEMPLAPFKTGGALDVMIGADPAASPDRQDPVTGDLRLVVTMVKGQTWALLYQAVIKGTANKDKVPFSSPWRTITFDQVKDISSQVHLAGSHGDYEFSVPLNVLGIKPANGMKVKGDIGILRGESNQTTARIYWSNKAAGITADVPSEAMLTPGLWGTFQLIQEK
jgi:hypothetical protein